MRLLYTFGIWFYTLGIRIAALFGHDKARLMVAGWRQWPEQLKRLDPRRPKVWFHSASLGEFEQARPVLEAYRIGHPDCQIVVSFFSPSGYEIRKNYSQADSVCYLPMDTPRNAKRFVSAINPHKVFFVKYEFWFNYLNTLRRRGTKTYLFSSIFRPSQYFFQWYGSWFLAQLSTGFTHLFVQNNESLRLLRSHGIEHCSLAGDTRFDRVHQIAQNAESNPVAERFLAHHVGSVLVAGSTWLPDEQLLAQARNKGTGWFPKRIILAPHVISEEHLKQIENLFPDSIRYSQMDQDAFRNDSANGPQILIVDNIGLLSKLYRYATIAYIGGGFGVGIHNILEAVTFGKPVFFGPNYKKFKEAVDIVACGGGWSIASPADLTNGTFHNLLSQPDLLAKASKACTDYMQSNLGSTNIILHTIEE